MRLSCGGLSKALPSGFAERTQRTAPSRRNWRISWADFAWDFADPPTTSTALPVSRSMSEARPAATLQACTNGSGEFMPTVRLGQNRSVVRRLCLVRVPRRQNYSDLGMYGFRFLCKLEPVHSI